MTQITIINTIVSTTLLVKRMVSHVFSKRSPNFQKQQFLWYSRLHHPFCWPGLCLRRCMSRPRIAGVAAILLCWLSERSHCNQPPHRCIQCSNRYTCKQQHPNHGISIGWPVWHSGLGRTPALTSSYRPGRVPPRILFPSSYLPHNEQSSTPHHRRRCGIVQLILAIFR